MEADKGRPSANGSTIPSVKVKAVARSAATGRLAVGVVWSGFDPFQPEPEHAPQVRFTLWHEPAPEPLGSGSPGLVRQVRVHGTEFW